MGMFDRLRGRSDGREFPTAAFGEQYTQVAGTAPGEFLHITPDKDNGGMATAARVWGRLHTPETRRFQGNVTDPISFEVHYDGDTVDFYMQTSGTRREALETRLTSAYTGSRIERPEGDESLFPSIAPGDHVAGATFTTKQHYFYPLRGWGDLEADPYADVIEEMTAGDCRAVMQIIARDEPDTWTRGDSGGLLTGSGRESISERAERLRAEEVVGWRDPHPEPASEEDQKKADIIEAEQGTRGYGVRIRVCVIAGEQDQAQRRCEQLTELLEGAYEARATTGQTLVGEPVSQRQLPAFVELCHARSFEPLAGHEPTQGDGAETIFTLKGLAATAHFPTGDALSNPSVRWSLGDLGEGIQPSHAGFDWEKVDLPPDASREQKQIPMIDASGPGDPYLVGWGLKHGVEAAIYEEFLNAHMQATGRTRMGKTTYAGNIAAQAMRRGRGGLVIVLGKDDDDEDFIAEWPDDRPRDDFVFIDTGSTFEKKVRFNLLEVPDELEPGTTEHRSYAESLADDFCAAFAQAGGDDSLYPLMKGVTRTLVRGMALSGQTCTPLDLAEAASRHANMAEFAAWAQSEELHFIDDTALRFAEEKDEGDFEPIARRMDELRQNGNLREWLAARDPTVRIQNLVDEGKWCVLRIDDDLGDTERAFAINPIVRRFGHAKKMASKRGTNTDPYWIIWDEADKAITKHSSVGEMLSEYGGYGVRFFLLYQSPSYQLPAYLKEATEAQIDTTVSFRTEGKDASWIAKQHSSDITAESLDLPRFSCLLNTDGAGDVSTPSVRVRAFPPIREVRARVAGEEPMSDEEVHEMKRESVERYGATPPSAEEMKAQLRFSAKTSGDGGADDDDARPTELDMDTEYCRNQALKAIYDVSIRQGTPGGFVAVDTLLDRLQDYLPGGESITDSGKAWREVFQQIPDAYLAHRMNDQDDREVRADDTGFMNVGTTENDGADEHWEQMADAYIPMTQLGFVYEIPAQTGEAMPDAIARLDDVLELEGVDDPGAIAERVNAYRDKHRLLDRLAGTKDLYIESEHSTGATQPSQTIENLVQAANDGHRCLFIAREAVAERVHNTLEREPFCCRTSHPEPGERRFYTATNTLVIEGETMTRPGAAENVWIHDEAADEYLLKDTNGTVHARFSTPAEIFEAAGKYPAGGERTIKPPVIPEHEFDEIDAVEYDIVVVPEPERNEHGEKEPLTPFDLELYRDESENVPLPYLVDDIELDISAPHGNGEPTAATTIDEAAEEFENGHRN